MYVCVRGRERESVCVCAFVCMLKIWHKCLIICFWSHSLCCTPSSLCLLSLLVMSLSTLPHSFCLRQKLPQIFLFDFYFLEPCIHCLPPADLCLFTKAPSPNCYRPPTLFFPSPVFDCSSIPLHSFITFFTPFSLHHLSLAWCHSCPSGAPIPIPPTSFSSPAMSPATVSHRSPQLSF